MLLALQIAKQKKRLSVNKSRKEPDTHSSHPTPARREVRIAYRTKFSTKMGRAVDKKKSDVVKPSGKEPESSKNHELAVEDEKGD